MATGLPNVSNNDALAARNFAIEVDGTTIAQFTDPEGHLVGLVQAGTMS